MNPQAIEQFKNQTNSLLTQLHLFLRWCEEVEAQDKLYEDKLKYIAAQNKLVEDKRDKAVKKEQENIAALLTIDTERKAYEKKREELLFKEARILKLREQLAADTNMLEKEKTRLAQVKIDVDALVKREKMVGEREKKVALDESYVKDAREKLSLREEQVNLQAKRVSDILKK
jgi:hypothetical protein